MLDLELYSYILYVIIDIPKLLSRWDVVSLHPLGGEEHKTTSFPNPWR